MNIIIVPISEAHIAGFRACLDAVAREKKYLAQYEAPSLDRVAAFVRDGMWLPETEVQEGIEFSLLARLRSLDLMHEIYGSLGRRLKLDAVAEGTLGQKKTGHGGQSIKWWRDGEIEKVRDYCLKDVELTKGIFAYALEHGTIKYRELGKTREIQLKTEHWLAAAAKPMTFSMGF